MQPALDGERGQIRRLAHLHLVHLAVLALLLAGLQQQAAGNDQQAAQRNGERYAASNATE